MRFRTPEYDGTCRRRPDVGHGIPRRYGRRRPVAGNKNELPFPADAVQPGSAPEPNLTVWYSPHLPDAFRRFAAQVAIDTSSIQFESDEIMRSAWGDDGAIACCVSPTVPNDLVTTAV